MLNYILYNDKIQSEFDISILLQHMDNDQILTQLN